MPQHRARPASRARLIAGGAALAGTALIGLAGAAQAATPDVVPDLGPLLSAPNDDQPDPAPTAPYVEPSTSAYGPNEPLKHFRDVAPAGVPVAGLADVATQAPERITPTVLQSGTVGE